MRRIKNMIKASVSIVSLLIGTLSFGNTSKAEDTWSSWSDTKPANASQYDVEERTVYRYRDKSTTTSTSSIYSDWIWYDSETVWGSWSAWQDSSVSSSSTREVNTRTVYRYRDKSTTTSTSSTLSGWTQYDSKTVWGSWSSWQDAAVSASTTRQVETQQVQVTAGYTQYRYWRWQKSDDSWWHFCDACAASQRGGTWYQKITPWQNTPITNWDIGNLCNHGYNYNNEGQKSYIYSDGTKYYYEQTQYIQPTYKTQYRYKDSTTTYYYYKWSDWSSWSTTSPSAASNRESEDKTQYQYRDSTTTHYFYKMSDWSDWIEARPVTISNREIEDKKQYRYKEKSTTEENTTEAPSATDNPNKTEDPNTTVTPGTTDKPNGEVTPSTTEQPNSTGTQSTTVTNGSKVKVAKVTYTVTDTQKATVTYTATGNKKSNSITVPATVKIEGKKYKVTKIADNAFKNNKKLKKVKIGSNVTSIGKNAFKGCTNLKTLTLGKNVKTIGNSAFEGCKKLEKVTITKNVTAIGNKAFYNCKGLKIVAIKTTKLKKVGKKSFGNTSKKRKLDLRGLPEKLQNKYRYIFKDAV